MERREPNMRDQPSPEVCVLKLHELPTSARTNRHPVDDPQRTGNKGLSGREYVRIRRFPFQEVIVHEHDKLFARVRRHLLVEGWIDQRVLVERGKCIEMEKVTEERRDTIRQAI